ncbi:MAG: carbohydrate-binding protein [Elusimicrobia bacterium]|nr:carbohydrate-binding protein [Elusimicrobiota bacterium]
MGAVIRKFMMRAVPIRKFVLVVMAIGLATAGTINAATYYVATTGNDGNPGTEASPWRTIQKGASTAVAGDTVYIKTGTYTGQVDVKNSGSAGKYITFSAYPGNTVTIDGSGVDFTNNRDGGIFQIWDKSYIKVNGLRIIHSGYAGLYANKSGGGQNAPSYIEFTNNYIEDTWASAILIMGGMAANGYGQGVIISGNTVYNGHNQNPTQNHEVISVGGGQNNFDIFNNYISYSFGGVFDSKDGVSNGKIHDNTITNCDYSGIYIDAYNNGARNIQVYNNKIFNQRNAGTDCNGINVASEQPGGVLDGVYIYNNLIYNNPGTALRLTRDSQGTVKNVTFENNTIYNNGIGNSDRGGIYLEYTPATGIIIRNNIFANNNSFQIRSDVAGATITNNVVYGTQPYGSGSNVITSNPLFISTSIPDFHLQATSPAIDKGSSASFVPSVDYAGTTRPQGAGYDIGAYEYGSTVSPAITVTAPNGGESWAVNSNQTVTWTSAGTVGNVKIEISTDGGTTWSILNSKSSITNDGSESVTVPNTPSATCRIRVSETDGSPTDTSNANFTITAPVSQSPYGGTARSIPGTIQVEDFDNGGEGVAYHDTDGVNEGNLYRTADGVDIEATTDTGGGYNIGWTLAGEWLEYTVNVVTAGTYTLEARVASESVGGKFHVEFNGTDKTGPITVPTTGGNQTWTTVSKTVSLSSGQQVMRVALDSIGDYNVGNINYIKLVKPGNASPTVSITAPANGATYNTGASVTINCTAIDSDGTVASVKFYAGSTLLATDISAPYSYTWTPAVGSYSLTAVATDNLGATGTSPAISITVTYTPPVSTNIVKNPGFESGKTSWLYYAGAGGSFTASTPGYTGTYAGKCTVTAASTNIQLYQTGISLKSGTKYRLSFSGYSTTGNDVSVRIFKHVSPYTSYSVSKTFNLTTSWQKFTTEFIATGFTGTVSDGRLQFWFASYAKAGDVYYIDDVQLEEVSILAAPSLVSVTDDSGNLVIAGNVREYKGSCGIAEVIMKITGNSIEECMTTANPYSEPETITNDGYYEFNGISQTGSYVIEPENISNVRFWPRKMSYSGLSSDLLEANYVCRQLSVTRTVNPQILINSGMAVTPLNDSSSVDSEINLVVPKEAFSQSVNMTLTAINVPISNKPALKVVGYGVNILNDKNLQPVKEVTITINYDDSGITGSKEANLVLGWYDEVNNRWVTLPTTVYSADNKVVAKSSHLGKFALLELVPAADLSNIKIYPMPYNPLKNTAGMIIENLTAGAVLKIYTVGGDLVRELSDSNNSGSVVWNGKNESGNTVASGVYILYIKGTTGVNKIKIAVEK